MATVETNKLSSKRGFTIIELAVVVTIIGLIASIAIPAYTQSRQNSIASRTANDFRQFAEQFHFYNLKNGEWPDDGLPGTTPPGMEDYLADGSWSSETPLGGLWDFDHDAFSITSGVSIDGATFGDETLTAIDALLDDGNLSSGDMIKTGGNRLTFILQR